MTAQRPWLAGIVFTVVLVELVACGPNAEKCREAQHQADAAWQQYVEGVLREQTAAKASLAQAQQRLATEIEPRVLESVKKATDLRYDRPDPAWMRAYEAARVTACRADVECSSAQTAIAREEERIAVLAPRIEAATGALERIRKDEQEARRAVAAVPTHDLYPELRAAREASAVVWDACKGVAQ